MARPTPSDEGSPTRIIATMVGIVGILLLGSLAWSAVGAMFSALGEATAVFTTGRPTPTKLAAAVATATVAPVTPVPQVVSATSTSVKPRPAATPAPETPLPAPTATPGVEPTAQPTPPLTATPNTSGRAPWLLLPQPAPDGRVPPGSLTVEARARGDAPIAAIRLELDGAALAVALEQRSEDTWRGSASTQVGAGRHAVRATVTDDQGRTGSFRWSFDAGP